MLLAAGCQSTFACDSDSQCQSDGQPGVCQAATGFCSFPADDCESGQKYGDLSPQGLAGTCVPGPEGGSTSTTDDGTVPTTGPVSDDDNGPSTSGSDTGPSVDGTTTGSTMVDGTTTGEDTGGGSSDDTSTSGTGGTPACCDADCPQSCEAIGCQTVQLGEIDFVGEAIGVAVVGEHVVWSTGFGRTLEMWSAETDQHVQLAIIDQNSFVTRIASDGDEVYFLDYGGGTVRRVSVPGGGADLVSVVQGGEAHFGGLAVDDTHVYFAMRGTGGVWRAAKDTSDVDGAELVSMFDGSFGVAVDDSLVYFIDTSAGEIRRIAKSEVGQDTTGTIVVEASNPTTLAVDDDGIYFAAGGAIRRADKLGSNQNVSTLATGQGNVWQLVVDSTDIYFTSSSSDAVGRVSKTGGATSAHLSDTDQPWGIAADCSSIYWAENGTQTLQSRLK